MSTLARMSRTVVHGLALVHSSAFITLQAVQDDFAIVRLKHAKHSLDDGQGRRHWIIERIANLPESFAERTHMNWAEWATDTKEFRHIPEELGGLGSGPGAFLIQVHGWSPIRTIQDIVISFMPQPTSYVQREARS